MNLWTPEQQRQENETIRREHERLVALFAEHPDWQKEADALHQRRMLGGPACDQCMQIIQSRHRAS